MAKVCGREHIHAPRSALLIWWCASPAASFCCLPQIFGLPPVHLKKRKKEIHKRIFSSSLTLGPSPVSSRDARVHTTALPCPMAFPFTSKNEGAVSESRRRYRSSGACFSFPCRFKRPRRGDVREECEDLNTLCCAHPTFPTNSTSSPFSPSSSSPSSLSSTASRNTPSYFR